MKLFIKPLPAVVSPKAEISKKPAFIPEKLTVPALKTPKINLKEDISEEDLERLAAEMEETAKLLKEKKGIDTDLTSSKKEKDTAWTIQFKNWGEKRGFKCDLSDFSEHRIDLYKEDAGFTQWRICIVRSYTTFNFGFYFNISSGGYPKSLEFSGIYKDKSVEALGYMYKALVLFEDKG